MGIWSCLLKKANVALTGRTRQSEVGLARKVYEIMEREERSGS